MGKEFKVRILMRYTDSEGWKTFTNEGHILAEGEIGFEYLPDSALPIMKVGNGKLTWENLPPFQAMLFICLSWGFVLWFLSYP